MAMAKVAEKTWDRFRSLCDGIGTCALVIDCSGASLDNFMNQNLSAVSAPYLFPPPPSYLLIINVVRALGGDTVPATEGANLKSNA